MQTKIYQLGHLLPVRSNTKLLADNHHQTLLQEIKQLSGMPESHFRELYRPAINRFAEFVQLVAEEPQNALGGLLNLGLARGYLGLRQFAESGVSLDADPLINYAVFTAGLFYDVAKVISQQKIVICDIAGNYLQDWFPYLGSMIDQGAQFYKMYPYHSTIYQALNHDAAAVLARQLMPHEGFAWLSSDLEIFIDWLDALRGDQGTEGRRISRLLALIRHEDLLGLMKHLLQVNVELILPKEMPLEDQFFIWLREGLANGTIAVNTQEAFVHLLDDGDIYLNNEVFKQFQEASKVQGDMSKLAQEFNEKFGVEAQVIPGKIEYATFLGQRGTQKTIQVRNGMFAFGTLFLVDLATVGVALSPLLKEIRNTFQTGRELPGIKQINVAEKRPNNGPNFKMR